MSHEIEADFKEDYDDEERQCHCCTSFQEKNSYCTEAKSSVPSCGHCDFFQAKD